MRIKNYSSGKKKKSGDNPKTKDSYFHCSFPSLLTLLWITFGIGVSVGFMIIGFIAR